MPFPAGQKRFLLTISLIFRGFPERSPYSPPSWGWEEEAWETLLSAGWEEPSSWEEADGEAPLSWEEAEAASEDPEAAEEAEAVSDDAEEAGSPESSGWEELAEEAEELESAL